MDNILIGILQQVKEFDVKDKIGRSFTVREYNGERWIKELDRLTPGGSVYEHLKMLRNLKVRDSDIMICSYAKSGAHWIWEIVAMLTKGKAEYEKNCKETAMLEFLTKEVIEKLPEPRILNTHYKVNSLPTELFKTRAKTIHVQRNPKDAMVSWFHHASALHIYPGTFDEYYPMICGYGDNSYLGEKYIFEGKYRILWKKSVILLLDGLNDE